MSQPTATQKELREGRIELTNRIAKPGEWEYATEMELVEEILKEKELTDHRDYGDESREADMWQDSKAPKKQKFKYYLHDDASSYEREDFIKSQGIELSEMAWENMGRPFYEIELTCEVDEDGKVTIIGVKQMNLENFIFAGFTYVICIGAAFFINYCTDAHLKSNLILFIGFMAGFIVNLIDANRKLS